MAYRDRTPIPDFIQNAPELRLGEDLFFNGFMDLDTCRNIGFGKGQIPWLAIVQYCQFNQYERELIDDFIYVIRKLDNQLLILEQQKSQGSKPSGRK